MNSKRSHFLIRIFAGLAWLAMLAFGAVAPASAASIIYVNKSATGANNGSSWTNAYKNLQTALAAAVSGDQIWVATGVYRPTATTDRTQTFALKNGVAVYGGFAGTETMLTQRNVAANVTTLSGDIGVAGAATDNVYEVVSASNVGKTAVLDGFHIVGGQADCGCFPGDAGGGVFNYSSNATYNNLTISNNYTAGYGGGMYVNSSSPTLTNVTFNGNRTLAFGGGMYNISSNPRLTNVTFSGNQGFSSGIGGGMYNDGSSPVLKNVTFSANTSTGTGGGLSNVNGSNPTLTNVIFMNNTASTYGGGIYNSSSSPTLTNVVIQTNTASDGGGGIYNNASSPVLLDVTVSGNSGAFGGGIEDYTGSNATLQNVTVYGNSGSTGGGMYNNGSNPTLTNVTFSANSVSLNGPAMDNDTASTPTVYDSIFWNDSGGEIWNVSPGMTINDSIVAGGCPAGSTCTNLSTADPVLGPLQANGGFSNTMALGAGSSAIDSGNTGTCAPMDQRGVMRPQGQGCDKGAYEVQALSFRSVAAYDGWVLESAQASNMGGSLDTASTMMRVGDDDANRRYRAFVSFDTSPLPDTATVVMAELRIRQQSAVGNPFSTQGQLLADVTKPYFGPALGLAAADWQAASTANAVGVLHLDSSIYYSVLKGPGRTALNKTGTTQFRLRFNAETYNATAEYLSLFTGEHSPLATQPQLIVYYNP